ncbi:receptor-like serine/threonine-protein kinase At1g78530 isoform X2 [Solanum lycopersicum]|uniref:receptor-like serine/threonine-protein kinase At1g78530 isoform X2 n=1 Tax=Solanum lycopersicum TaxID=4081 RepID=UPI0008FEBC6B|nr:receptor-like protein kinase HSL1 isoform X2 [Solanum lycopersicum]
MIQASSKLFWLNMQIFFLISLSFQETLQFSGTERSILLNMKQHWSDSEFFQSWNSNSSECTWPGVWCIDDRVVTELHLGGKNITGTISSILCELKNLTFIDLSNNNISGIIPLSLKDCSMLQHLDLSNNSLSDRIPGFGVAIQLTWIFYMVRKHWWKTKKRNVKDDIKFISFQKLKVTTEDILCSLKDENIIGNGGSGKVYRVVIDQTGSTYAVKSIGHGGKSGGRPQKEFLAEVRTLGSIRHNNIVKLMCCISSLDRKLLVYEYFEKQSLDKWLHGEKRAVSPGQSSTPALDWRKRLNIATGAAQGLSYMHHDCTRPIIHRDIKSSNILLDSEFNAKIADFGLAKILSRRDDNPETASAIAGTFGYIAPEYASTFRVNIKTDIYSFGVVLLELTTGRQPILREEQMNLAQWAQQRYKDGNYIVEALDEEIMETSNVEQMRDVFKLGLMCTGASPSSRPSMKEVCNILQSLRDPIF